MSRSTLTNFRAEDFGSESKPDNLPGETVVEDTETSQEVPTGTSREVLDWVGDDKDRAQRALDAEEQDETPRKSLTAKLRELVGEDSESK